MFFFVISSGEELRKIKAEQNLHNLLTRVMIFFSPMDWITG